MKFFSNNRWGLIKAVTENEERNETKLIDFVVEACSTISKNNKSTVLDYYVNSIKKSTLSPNSAQYIELLNSVLNKLTINEYQTLLMCCQKLITSSEENLSTESEEQSVIQNRQDLIIKLQTNSQDTEPLIGSGYDAVSSFSSSVSPHGSAQPSHNFNINTEIKTSLHGSVGILQIFREIFVNDLFNRNAFEEYKKVLRTLSTNKIEKALTSGSTPDQQLMKIKQYAARVVSQKSFGNSLYSGFVYSITFGIIAGSLMPYVFALSISGIVVSIFVARKHSNAMNIKIQGFINNPELDIEAVTLINNQEHKIQQIVENCFESNFSILNRYVPYSVRLTSLISAVFLPFLPLVYGMGNAINSLFTWRYTSAYLETIYNDPNAVLNNVLNTDVQTPWLFKYYGSNLIRTYIFNILKLGRLEEYLKISGIAIRPESYYSTFRKILSTFGLIENAKTKSLLDALYDGSNPNAVQLLDKLRSEARYHELYTGLNQYLSTHKHPLDMFGDELNEIIDQHNKENNDKFYRLLKSYLESLVKSDVKFAVWNVGATVGFAWASLLMALGLIFFTGFASQLAMAAAGICITTFIATSIAERRIKKNVNVALHNISETDFKNFINKNKMPHILWLRKKLNYTSNDIESNKYASKSMTRMLMVKCPWLYNYKNSNILKNLTHPIQGLVVNQQYIPKNDSERILKLFCDAINESSTIRPLLNDMTFNLEVSQNVISMNSNTVAGEMRKIFDINLDNFYITIGTDLTKVEWQIYMAFMQIIGSNLCLVDFNNGREYLSEDRYSQSATDFAAAVISEFLAEDYIRCKLLFCCLNIETKQAIYKFLENKEISVGGSEYNYIEMEKLRAHFGLMLLNDKLYDLNKISYGENYPFVNKDYMHNIDLLTDVESIQPEQNKTEIYQLPSIITQLFDGIVELFIFGTNTILNYDENDISIELDNLDLSSEDPEFDDCIKQCFKARFDLLQTKLKNIMQAKNEINPQDETRQPFLYQQKKADVENRTTALESEYIELLKAIKNFHDKYTQFNEGVDQEDLAQLASDYYDNRHTILVDEVVDSNNERHNVLFTFLQGNKPADKEKEAVDQLKSVLKRYGK